MAQPPEATAAPAPARARTPRTPRSFSDMPAGYIFQPKASGLLRHYLVPRALDGCVPEENIRDSITEGVDVYAVRPEALPFNRRNRDRGQAWAYFFTTRPAAAGGSTSTSSADDDDDDVREVAAGGCWRRYGGEKGYAGKDGEPYAFRRTFAFHEPGSAGGGRKTAWRVKEYRLDEAAPAFRGAVFHPSAKGLVVCKVYNEVMPEEEPPVDYYNSDDEKSGAAAITVRDAIDAPAGPAASKVCTPS